ncbi:MAG: hypothetical protein JWR70_1980 [Modestobacter sp.]|nr:hypothetical protein [Modestobacter sp.]
MSFAVPLLSLGLLVLVGTALTLAAAPLTPSDAVPLCCRRRVDAFARWARPTVLAAVLAAGAGVVLLVR